MALRRTLSDFIDVDLSTPGYSKVALVTPSMHTAVDLSPQNAPQDWAVPAVPLSSLNTSPGTEQLHPPNSGGTNLTVINGTSGTTAPACNPLVNASLRTQVQTGSDVTVTSQCRPPVDAQVRIIQNCGGALGPRMTGGSIDGGRYLAPPFGRGPASATLFYIGNTDCRALQISSADAKQAFQDYSKTKCCYGRVPDEDLMTEELQPLNTYRYSLETFTESRSCEWITEKYTGQHVDALDVRSALQPWEVLVAVPDMFKDGMRKMKVPNTSAVKECSQCRGVGKSTCLKCHGTGRIPCMWCNGTGRRMEMCQQCYGHGTESCRICNNANSQNCSICDGQGQVLTYMELTVTWENNKYIFISDHNSEFSSDLFRTVHGERVFTEEQIAVSPLADFPDSSITWASQNALEQHRIQFSNSCRVIRQRQSVELLPLTKVRYVWKGGQLNYFVYGIENKVYMQNSPPKSCCIIL
ncbi:protein SSUH2 homolog [Eleutherodactylus coqui]|uniref:protein SSUH2 homolog n=1 Tax=Eleutherodactylus coqui TaxID=57060 RepID=UPI003462BD41